MEGEQNIEWLKGALLGRGSSGSVYLCMCITSGQLIAVRQVVLPTDEQQKKAVVDTLDREIKLMKGIQNVNIIQYLDYAFDKSYLNVFVEYAPGGSVATLLRANGPLDEALCRTFTRDVLHGLDYLHEKGMIHGNIKAAKIFVDNKGVAKITMFGISQEADEKGTGRSRSLSSLGSVFWMAPETVKQLFHTRKADIWSIGCLLIEMLTGEHPWADSTRMQAIFKIGSGLKPTIPSNIPDEAENFLNHTLIVDQKARPPASELLRHVWVSGGSFATVPQQETAV